MAGRRFWVLFLLLLQRAYISSQQTTPSIPQFSVGTTYVYTYRGITQALRDISVHLTAKLLVSVCDGTKAATDELHVNITDAVLTWTTTNNGSIVDENLGDLTNWFSIVRESNGTISTVYHPFGEPETVLAFKKALAGLLSVDAVSSDWSAAGDRAVLVHEALNHRQTVRVHVRKTSTIDIVNQTLVEVTAEEQMIPSNAETGTLMEQPMWSQSTLTLHSQRSPTPPCHRPPNLIHDDIIITSLVRAEEAPSMEVIQPLIVCAPDDHNCAQKLEEIIPLVSDDNIATLLQQYLDENAEHFSLPQALSLLSAVSTSSPSPSTIHILTSLLLPSLPHPLPSEQLVSKLLFHFTVSLPVDKYSVDSVWLVVTDHHRASPSIKTQALLALGAMAKRVRPSNQDLARQIVTDLHHLLEQHTGYSMPLTLHKHRRSTIPQLPSSLPHSSLHALLIDCLANAGADESFPTLKHHTRSGELSVRHAAIRAMGGYDTDESAEAILLVAEPSTADDDYHPSLTRAARSTYQTHPRRKRELANLPDPSSVRQGNPRLRRDVISGDDDVVMNITMPTVGWNRQFGDANITTGLSRAVSNAFILDTTEQSSQYHFSFHDEMMMTSHLALTNDIADEKGKFEMMKTQLCLEGTASYNTINILIESTPERTYQQYLKYREASSELVEDFEEAYEQLLLSNLAYDNIPDALITELDDLINEHFEDVLTQLGDSMSRLDAIRDEFYLKSVAWDIHSSIWSATTHNRASATTARETILSALNDALPTKPEGLYRALLVDGQPFTTHSFHVPYLPYAPQKALINILDVYRSTKDAYDELQSSVKRIVDLTDPNGPNHLWLSPPIRRISDDLATLTSDIIRAINEVPTEDSDGLNLDELNELYDIVNFDLRDSLNALVGVADDVIARSAELSTALEGSRQAFTSFTLSYDSARSTVDAILGQKFHPLFPRQRRSCDHQRGCGSYPTTSDQGYGEGVALVMSEGEQVVAPLSGYYSLSTDQLSLYDASSTIKLTPVESSYHDLSFTLTHVLPSLDLTGSPMFIRGGEPLGIFIPEPQTGNTDNEYYIHLEAHKTIGNETYTIDPTQFLLPIHDPQVALSYDCNDLVTYIGSTVVDRRKLAPDSPEVVPYGAVLVEDSIPGHEFQRPLDHRVQARGTILSGASVEVFSSSTALMVGPIPVQLDFHGVGDYELSYSLDMSLLSRQATVSVTPSLSSRAHGYMRTSGGGVQYATVTLEGTVLEASLPLTLWHNFLEWPLTASSQMDLVLSPSSLSLVSQLARTTGAGEFASEEILQTRTLWSYEIPPLNRDEFYYQGSLVDETPPAFQPLPYTNTDCYVRQLAVSNFYNPLFEIEFSISEPQGLHSTTYQIGAAPKTDDIIGFSEITGSRIVLPHHLIAGSPIHVTVTATNRNGYETLATCSMTSYDRSPPLARITPVRPVSSHPSKIAVLFSLFDEFGLDTPLQVAIGTVPGEYGADVMDWVDFDISSITTPPTANGNVLNHFSFMRAGRLVTEVLSATPHTPSSSQCAQQCLESSACRSFDHSPSEANCILHSGIEGPATSSNTENVFETPPLQFTSDYGHYERLGVGNSTLMEFTGLSLSHSRFYYINMRLVNGLGFTSTVSSTPFLVDLTPPSPGNVRSVTSDEMTTISCDELSISGLDCLESTTQSNHRVIVDGHESGLVFNGLVPLSDAMYTSTANYITANWQGLEDLQSGVHTYRWWVGSELGRDDVIPPTDPHMHLIGGQSAWTNSGLATGLQLADGSYYISVQAISGVEYGGHLVTTIHHSTAYVLDTSPPQLNDVIINDYDSLTNQLIFSYNASDDESGLYSVSLSLGRTEHDMAILSWTGVGTSRNGMVTVDIPDGVDTWVKLRATNNAGLSSIAVAEMPVRIDRSPPLYDVIGDGDDVIRGDVDYQRHTDTLCVHGTGVVDLESGIIQIIWDAGTSAGAKDIVNARDITESLITTGTACVTGLALEDHTTYHSTLYITNGAVTSLTTTVQTDGVLVDTTSPMGGTVHTWTGSTRDALYSSDITNVMATWEDFYDDESGIEKYRVRVMYQSADSNQYDVIYTETVDGDINELTLTHFSFGSNDSVIVEVRAENGAGGRVTVESNPYTIDLSPPHVSYLVDGDKVGQDLQYQAQTNRLMVSWSAEDEESRIEKIEISILVLSEGRRLHIYPDPVISGQSELNINPTLNTYTVDNLSLIHGSKYVVVLTLTNGAGLVAQYETTGVVIDVSPPIVTAVAVDGELTLNQGSSDVDVLVPSAEHVTVRWLVSDDVSGVAEILIGILDENDTVVAMTTYPGSHSGGAVIGGLDLAPSSLYRVSVTAVNHATTQSPSSYSQQFRVLSREVSSRVSDGEDPDLIDVDYTDEATAVTVHFDGFSGSRCGGMSRYEWAVGEGWEEEEEQQTIMSFTERGLVVVNGTSGSGYAQALLPDLAKYGSLLLYITVRGSNDCGDITQSTSNGFIIDPSPPSLEILGTGENAIEHAQSADGSSSFNHTTYQTNPSFSSLWQLTDDQSGTKNSGVVRIGTYPGGGDVQDETTTTDSSIRSELQAEEGLPYYVTVTGTNRAGLSLTASGRAVVLDTTPPTLDQLRCTLYGFPPPFPLTPNSPSLLTSTVVTCEWSDIGDAESGVTEYTATITETSHTNEVIYKTSLAGSASGFETPSLSLNDTVAYLVTLDVTNGAGLHRLVHTEVSHYTSTVEYSGQVHVMVNFAKTGNTTGQLDDPEQETNDEEEFVCLYETDVISIEFSAPFDTQNVNTESFEVGIGYFPGSDGHRTFTRFTPSPLTTHTYSHTLTHVDTLTVGRRLLYITVQARSNDNTRKIFKLISPPIYIKSSITQWDSWLVDGTDPNDDMELQTSTTEIGAYFSIGSHCPVTYARWAIEDANGTVVLDYVDVEIPAHSEREVQNEFALYTDQVMLYNEESYRVLVQAMDYAGEIFVLRSNGLTVTTDDISPSIIQDGPIPDEDLNYQESTDYLSAHWTEFGDGTPQQEISYYEAAAGSNVGYPNTRSNIAPFTNIGLNISYMFTNLDLIPESVVYTITVRATAVSGDVVEATSNGIRAGHRHTILPGDIILVPYSSNTREVTVYWDEFVSNVPIRSYEWAIGATEFSQIQLQNMCDDYLSIFESAFEVFPFTDVGLDMSAFVSGLNLTGNTTYYVTIRATDEANQCITVMSSGMLVDLSKPIPPVPSITLGPSESVIGLNSTEQYIVYLQSGHDLRVWWEPFNDPESDIEYYDVALLQQIECGSNDNLSRISGYVNTGLSRYFTLENPALMQDNVYVVEVRATNKAGLKGRVYSEPILVDWANVLPGEVKDGLDWESDMVFQSDLSMLSGVFSHAKLASRYPGVVLQNDPCPNTTFHSLTVEDSVWQDLIPESDAIVGITSATILYDEEQTNFSTNGLVISAEYDESVKIKTGAYQTKVDLSTGGLISLDIRAALGATNNDRDLEAQSITSAVFIDTPDDNILADFEYDPREDYQYPLSPELSAVGFQIHHSYDGMVQKVVIWSRASRELASVVDIAHDIPNVNLSEVHTYTLDFQIQKLDTDFICWVDFSVDGQLVATLHGITRLSSSTRMVLHVFNRNGFIPTVQDTFNPPRVEAVFANVTLPGPRAHICDFGRPFYSASSPIVQFSVGIGTSPGMDDVSELELLSTPCRPCSPGHCSNYGCNSACTDIEPYTVNFTLSNLTLSPGYYTNQSDASSGYFEFESSNTANTLLSLFSDHFQPAVYFITVEAVTASGQRIMASSNGVIIDISPPEQIAPVDHFDVSFSDVQPIDFQASNETISVRWAFRDLQSGIVDYQWAIGTVPYATDVQPFISVGTELETANNDLLGILKHNTTYYVTVVATNGAGLNTSATSDGVTYSASVLNFTALEEAVEVEFVRSVIVRSGDGEDEEEVLVVEREDRVAIMWDGVPEDVEDIFWYIGTNPESVDILPKTEVSFNDSSWAEYEAGVLYLNGAPFANISEVIEQAEGGGGGGGGEGAETSYFVLEPGRLVYNTLEMCNFVHRCVAIETLPLILIRPSDGEVVAEMDGADLEVTIMQTQGQSTRVTDRDYTVTLTTSGGVEAGTVLVTGFLTHEDLRHTYRGAPLYISNPYTTMTQTSAEIARRFVEVVGPSFYVSFLGQDSLNGALTINATFDPNLARDGLIIDIFYWDNVDEIWREVNATCGTTSVVDWITFTVYSEVCATVVDDTMSSLRRRRQAGMSGSGSASGSGTNDISSGANVVPQRYLSGPVQFIVVGIGDTSANTAPQLLLPPEPLSIAEDQTLSDYQLHYTDMEGDEVEFYISSPPRLGTASLNVDGLFSYTPCTNCIGVDSFEIFIVEKPFGFNNVPLTASGILVVQIENENDPPFLYAFNPLSANSTDITTELELQVYVESNRSSPVSIAHIAALDVDGYFDDLSVTTQDGDLGHANVEIWLDIVSVLESLPVTSLPDDAFLSYIAFLAANITYMPTEIGTDIVRVRVRDTTSSLSDILTINIEVVPSWCLNDGVCNGSLSDPNCTDIEARRSTPWVYSCRCIDGFSGRYCEVDNQIIESGPSRECPDGIPVVMCEGNPCTNAVCPSNSSAECRPNYCGGCAAEWFVGNTQIECNADDPIVCLKPTTALACVASGETTCQCPEQPYLCPSDSIFVETRHSECCVIFECRCPESSCPLLMEGGLGVQPIPVYRGNRFPGRCCPQYSFEDINECEENGGNTCSDVCVNHAGGYSCDCPPGKTLSQDGQNCGVCHFEGREYLHGGRVKIGCNWCICQSDSLSGERWHCTAESCEASCTHNGVTYYIGKILALPQNQVSCVCEATDSYADWRCNQL